MNIGGGEDGLKGIDFKLDLNSRQDEIFCQPSINGKIGLEDKELSLDVPKIEIANSNVDLTLGNISTPAGISYRGIELSPVKEWPKKRIKPTLYYGKTTQGNVSGTKVNIEWPKKLQTTGYYFQGKRVVAGLNFSLPLVVFDPGKGSETNQGTITTAGTSNTAYPPGTMTDTLASSTVSATNTASPPQATPTLTHSLLNQILPGRPGRVSMTINGGYTISGGFNLKANCQASGIATSGEYGNKAKSFKWQGSLKTPGLTTESDYLINPAWKSWQLKSQLNSKKVILSGLISQKITSSSTIPSLLSYTWQAGYNWKLSEAINLSFTHQKSGQRSNYLSRQNNTSLSINLSFPQSPLNVSSNISLGSNQTKEETTKGQINLKRGLSLSYAYWGFKPKITYQLKNIRERQKRGLDQDEEEVNFSCSKEIIANLSANYQLSLSKTKSLSQGGLSKEPRIYQRANQRLDVEYKFLKLPLRIKVSTFSYRKDEIKWLLSINYREKEEKDALVCQPDETKFSQEKAFKFGQPPAHITPAGAEIVPSKDKLRDLGKIAIEVFEDNNMNGLFDSGEKGLEKTVAVMKKLKAVTNKHGKAYFIDVTPGEYDIIMDLGELPLNIVCGVSLHQTVKVEAGKITFLKFPLLKGGHISGRAFRDENKNGKWDKNEYGEGDLIIYANDSPTFTGLSGEYRFRNITPGTYTVKFNPGSLPDEHDFTTPSSFQIKVMPEQEVSDINFGYAEKEKEIDFE